MSASEAVKEFKNGFTALREGFGRRALGHFRKAVEMNSGNPFYLSYLGLALARVEKMGRSGGTLLCGFADEA